MRAEDRSRPDGDTAVDELRARAVWLAELSSWRGGFARALAEAHDGLGGALLLSPRAVAAFARRRRRAPRTAADADAEQEVGAFAAVLARGPSAEAAADPGVVTWVDEAYPPQLRELPDPPPALYVRGLVAAGLDALSCRHVVAVVGSRSPSAYGREMARAIARDLTAAGVLVVSGLALGIDAAAHEAALDAARGRAAGSVVTAAVLGCGADVEHPPSNRKLFARVRGGGLLVTEFAWGIGARPWRFPARNRVMAGLSEAVVVVEGAERSGALITARYALDLGRSVLAVPGEAGRRLSAGPHRLLRQGAAVCESAQDVLEELGYGDLAVGWADRQAGPGRRRRPGGGRACAARRPRPGRWGPHRRSGGSGRERHGLGRARPPRRTRDRRRRRGLRRRRLPAAPRRYGAATLRHEAADSHTPCVPACRTGASGR